MNLNVFLIPRMWTLDSSLNSGTDMTFSRACAGAAGSGATEYKAVNNHITKVKEVKNKERINI